MKIRDYFFNLGFFPDAVPFGSSSSLMNLRQQRLVWTVGVFILMALGIFTKQNICLTPSVSWCGGHSDWRVGLGSAILAFALLFPTCMREFNKRLRSPTWEHLLFAFSLGFFADLSTGGVAKILALLLTKLH